MTKKEEFKAYVAAHPELINHIKGDNMSWQKFYEIYDMYGDNKEAWQNYFKDSGDRSPSSLNLGSIMALAKKINMASVQKHIGTAQKAISLIQELGTKGGSKVSSLPALKGPINPRPINKFFED